MPIARKAVLKSLLAVAALCSVAAFAAPADYEIVIRDHRFQPSVLEIPAGQRVKIVVRNLDATPEEFESYELRREKIIAGKSEAIIFVGPLKPGTYSFFGEFNQETAQGRLVAK
jgi:plastocyanin